MGTSYGTKQPSNDQSLLLSLKEKQIEYCEGTRTWINLQSKIDEIVAQNYLHYVNR